MFSFKNKRQPDSFGRNQVKRWWPRARQGHSNFLHERWHVGLGKNIAARGFTWFAG